MLRTESYRRGVISSSMFNVIVKGIVFLNTIFIAYFFGTSLETDIYFYVFSVVVLIAGLVNGMDLSVIIPEGMVVMEEKGHLAAMKFYNFFGFIYLMIGVLLFFILFFFSIPIYSAVSTFKASSLNDHSNILVLSSALPLLMMLSNYYTSVLTTLKYFTAPLIANGIAQVFSLAALLFFHNEAGIVAVLAGMLAGYILNIVLLLVFMRSRLNWKFTTSRIRIGSRITKNLFTVQLGSAATFIYNYGIIVLLSSLGTGIYSAYSYSLQIVNIPYSFIVAQVAAVAGIKFNEEAAKKRYHSLNRLFQENMRIILFILVPICFLTWLYADTIVKLLFFRGTFDQKDADNVVYFVRFLIFLVPCLAINTFLSRLLISIKKVNESFYFQVIANIAILLIMFFSTRYFGLSGFLSSLLIMNYLYFTIACIFLMRWLMEYIEYVKFLKLFLRIILLNLPLFIISLYFFKYIFFIVPVFYIVVLLILNRFSNLIPSLHTRVFNLINVK